MKRAIDPSEIRKGDLVRYEGQDESTTTRAVEFCAERDGQSYLPVVLPGQHYLLHRPTPPVELPTEPALGIVSGTWGGPPRLAVWRVERDACSTWLRPVDNEGDTDRTVGGAVTNFVPATAVPTKALDRVRRVAATCDATYPDYKEALFTFLAAVDSANGVTS